MKLSKHRTPRAVPRTSPPPQAGQEARPVQDAPTLPMLVAGIFTKLRLVQRVRVLRRLLMPVGPMALAVLGGGAFSKFVVQARWPRMSVSLDDAARITSSQVFELVRYVEQSNPQVLQQVVLILSRDTATMAAAGATLAAVLIRQLSNRR
jgi:hypothetical protein